MNSKSNNADKSLEGQTMQSEKHKVQVVFNSILMLKITDIQSMSNNNFFIK